MNGSIKEALGLGSEQTDEDFFADVRANATSLPQDGVVTRKPTLDSIMQRLSYLIDRAEALGPQIEASVDYLLGGRAEGEGKSNESPYRSGHLYALQHLTERLDAALTHISVENSRLNHGLVGPGAGGKPPSVLG